MHRDNSCLMLIVTGFAVLVLLSSMTSFSELKKLRLESHSVAATRTLSSVTPDNDTRRVGGLSCFGMNASLDLTTALLTLQNKSILFIGDSTMRFQYVNLAFFLTSGLWKHPDPDRRNEWRKDFENFIDYHRTTNERLQFEICDCFRGRIDTLVEARYYHNPNVGVTLTYLQQLGMNPVRIHRPEFLDPHCNASGCTQAGCEPGWCKLSLPAERDSTTFPAVTLQELWIRETCRLKPTHVVVNVGHWMTNATIRDPLIIGKLGAVEAAVKQCYGSNRSLPQLIWWGKRSYGSLDQ